MRREDQSCNSSKDDEKCQSGSPSVIGALMGPLEGDDEPSVVTLGSGFLGNGDASSNQVASKNEEAEEKEEEEDHKAPIISNLSGDDKPGGFPKHDDGQKDASSINTNSIEDAALTKSTDDEEDPVNAPPISNTASDARKSYWLSRSASSSGSAFRDVISPGVESTGGGHGREVWYCCKCKEYSRTTPACWSCEHRKCFYCISFPSPKGRR